MSEIPKNLKMEYCSGSFYVIKGDDGLLYPEQLAAVIRRAEAYGGLMKAIKTVVKRIDSKDTDSSCLCQNGCPHTYCNNIAILQQALVEGLGLTEASHE